MGRRDPAWDELRTFLEVARDGSLSGAARRLGLTQPTVGRHIDALEEALGAALFTRSPRGLSATAAALALAPHAEAMAKARELLELVGLPRDAISRYPHQFSGGQRQRIAIARALALDPDVLVADEAVSALDVSVQAQVLDLLDEIQKRLGIALLFITHDLRVAAQICDEVVVMQHGRVVEQGPAAEVLTNPQQAYTRALLEAAPGRGWDFANFRPVSQGIAATA